jgi:hypothetical protein
MKHEKTETIPARTFVVASHYTCDRCEAGLEGSGGKGLMDICERCMKDRAVEFLEGLDELCLRVGVRLRGGIAYDDTPCVELVPAPIDNALQKTSMKIDGFYEGFARLGGTEPMRWE